MFRVGDGFMILIFLFAGCIQDVLSRTTGCNNTANGTSSGSTCKPSTIPTNQDGNKNTDGEGEDPCCNKVLYVAVVCFGVLTLPLIICTRVCWIKNLRKREQRRLNDLRRRYSGNNNQSVFTVESEFNLCDSMVLPPPYEAFSTPAGSDPPPPYEPPPPYTAKQEESEIDVSVDS